MADSEHEKTQALHEIAEEVERDRAERGHSVLDGEHVVGNEPDSGKGDEGATLAGDVNVIPPSKPFGN